MSAIYMWFQIYEEEYTTTLYPLETQDALLMSVDMGNSNYMAPIDFDQITFASELTAIVVRPLLLSAPEQNDEIEFHHELVSIVVRPLLLAAPEQNDEIAFGHELVDIIVRTILITTYMPDQGILLGIDMVPGSCYMTGV